MAVSQHTLDGIEARDPVLGFEIVANWLDWSRIKTITFAKDSETGEVFADIHDESGKHDIINFVD